MAATYGRVDETYRIILFAVLFFVLLVLRLWRLAAHSPVSGSHTTRRPRPCRILTR